LEKEMKPEHRHQLKTNELADWIVNFPQWAKENANTIIYISVIVAVVAAVYFWNMYEKRVVSGREQLELTNLISQISYGKTQILQAQAQGVDTSYALIQTADNLQNIAQNAKEEQMAALALIKRAEALRMELHYRFGSIGRGDLTAQINRAKDSYTKAIEKSSTNPSLMATAKLGLGLCEEELGNFEQARQIYGEIIANANFESTVAAAQARQRLHTMADYQQKVVLRQSPKRAPTEFIPEIKLEAPEGFQTQKGVSEVPEINNSGAQTPNSALEVPEINLPSR
jgi:tetratricopeptide (TPR) repeat protein